MGWARVAQMLFAAIFLTSVIFIAIQRIYWKLNFDIGGRGVWRRNGGKLEVYM